MTVITDTEKSIVVLLEITWGNSSIIRLNDVQERLVLPIGTFEANPSLKISLPPYTGIFERKTIDIEFAFLDTAFLFAAAITNGRAFSPAFVRAWQWIRTPGSDRLRKLFDGRVTSATRNPGGRQDILKLQAITAKSEAMRACGIIASNGCEWTFGDPKTCTVDLVPLRETGTITAIDRNFVTITGLAAHADRYWHKGYIEADGVRIKVREWISGTAFILSKLVPKDWEETVLGNGFKTIVVTPGCDKRPETCKNTWNNEPNNMTIGIAIPAYNPFFEDGS